MKILVAGWDSGGGVEAVQTVVGRAVARGHQVRVLGTEGLRSRFESAGAAFLRYKHAPDNDMSNPETDLVKDWQTRNPVAQWTRVRDRILCGPAREFCRDVAEELWREPADVAVVDTMIPAAMFGAEVSGVPAVIVMHGPYLVPRPGIPPLGTGWMPGTGPLGRLRDRSAAAVTQAVFRSWMPGLNRVRAEAGLPPVRDLPGLMARAGRVLVCSSPSYDFGSGAVPANVRYVGPQLDDDPGDGSGEWRAGEPGQPLVLVGLSSTVMRQEGLLQRAAGALGQLPVRGLVTTGPAVDPAVISAPGNVTAVSVAATATALVYTAVHPLPANLGGSGLNGAVVIVFIGAFATVGALLAWKRPENPLGWLLSATGLVYAVAAFGLFLTHFSRTNTLAAWLGFLYFLGFGLCVFVVLLFPTGKLPSRRWRPVAWAAGAGLAGWVLGCAFAPTIITFSPSTPNPVGVTGPAGEIFKLMTLGSVVLIFATGLAAIGSLAFRYRQAGTAERAQLKWLLYAGAVIVVALLATALIEAIMGPSDAATNLQNALSSGAVALVPVAIGIAVLRYRLYDIDRVISRTVAYAIVTGLLAGVYAGLVLLATQVLRFHTPVAVAAATLAAAAMFTPVRQRVQRMVDRRFNRTRYDGDRMAEEFAAGLKDAADLETVRADLAGVVSQALEPAHVSVWVNERG